MSTAEPRLIPLPDPLFTGDPVITLLNEPLPHGEPWSWLLARSLFGAKALAERLIASAPAGLLDLASEDLERLRALRDRLRARHSLRDLGCREATAAEHAALDVLERGGARELVSLYRRFGFAPFALDTAFLWSDGIVSVRQPDTVNEELLVGYEDQLAQLRANVERFLSGKPALSVLLYGARGTGKSTAVKALRTRFAGNGLRLIELLPEGIPGLPELLDQLHYLPQHFLLYIDDLSFSTGDPGWRRLKSLLDGPVWATPKNVLFIATSNRKNLLRNSWNDRPDPGSEPAAWDSIQEQLALADRFGMQLTFPPFDRKLYLDAVARHLGLAELDPRTRSAALRFAMEGRGLSGRTAKQFADLST